MANNYLDTTIVDKAIKFAVDAHSSTERRGKGFPYVIHVLEAMEIVSTITSDPELLAAAALHDTVEDTEVTIDRIREEFGDRIASVVAYESAVPESGDNSWRARKELALENIAAAPLDAKTVAIGDKLSNIRAICRDFETIGDKLWSRFHAPGGKDDIEWYYRHLAINLSDLAGTFAYAEFMDKISKVFGDPKPELIDMKDYEVSGDGMTAVSYFHRDGLRMIKLYADYIPLQQAVTELETSWDIQKLGINIPKAYRIVTDGSKIGVEFERIRNKKSFSRLMFEDPSTIERYSREFARECKKLHSTKCNSGSFRPQTDRFISAVKNSKKFDDAQKERILEYISSIPQPGFCCHGDLHIGNLITNGEKNWWIDLSDFSYGDPLMDIAMFYFVSHNALEELMMKLFHIDRSQILQSWDFFCREYFGENVHQSEIDAELEPYSALYMIFFGERIQYFPGFEEAINNTFFK